MLCTSYINGITIKSFAGTSVTMRTSVQHVISTVGWKFIWFLFIMYAGVKGGVGTLMELALLPLFQSTLAVSSSAYQGYKVIGQCSCSRRAVCARTALADDSALMTPPTVYVPFALKPLLGLAVDLCGTKKMHMVAFALIGATSAFILSYTVGSTSPPLAMAILASFVLYGVSGSDLITEAVYARYMNETPSLGSSLITYVWTCVFSARIVVALLSGHTADAGNVGMMVAAASVLLLTIVPAALSNCVEGEAAPPKVPVPENLVYMALLVGVVAMASVAVAMSTSLSVQLITIVIAVIALNYASATLLPTVVHQCNQYMFASAMLYLDVGVLDYWYTNECVTDGPHFSYAYFLTTATIVGSTFGCIGCIVFQTYLQTWSYRQLFAVTTVCKCSGAAIDIILVNRWNVGVISDKALFLLGNCAVRSLVGMLDSLPGIILVSRLVRGGNEATMYALLAGFQNLGATIAAAGGVVVANLLNVHISSDTCEYNNMTLLIGVCHVILPLCTLPMLVRLPKATMHDPIEAH